MTLNTLSNTPITITFEVIKRVQTRRTQYTKTELLNHLLRTCSKEDITEQGMIVKVTKTFMHKDPNQNIIAATNWRRATEINLRSVHRNVPYIVNVLRYNINQPNK